MLIYSKANLLVYFRVMKLTDSKKLAVFNPITIAWPYIFANHKKHYV